jgi:hypothetical protein
MPLSIVYALVALAVVLIVFLVVHRLRGLGFALAAASLAFIGLFAFFLAMAFVITSQMP